MDGLKWLVCVVCDGIIFYGSIEDGMLWIDWLIVDVFESVEELVFDFYC